MEGLPIENGSIRSLRHFKSILCEKATSFRAFSRETSNEVQENHTQDQIKKQINNLQTKYDEHLNHSKISMERNTFNIENKKNKSYYGRRHRGKSTDLAEFPAP
jgi:putative IMPACT (imprinted ancient) family translation regulator